MRMKLALASLLLLITDTHVMANCSGDDANVQACVKKILTETNVVLPGGVISDPGGGKTRAALANCQLECTTAHEMFVSRFGK
jgi:hypothetical protein